MKKAIFLITLLGCSISMMAQTHFLQNVAWQEVLKKAKAEDKLIFVDVYFTGCMPCAKMDKEVFPQEEVSAILNESFVSFKTDILKEEFGKKLCMKYAVGGFPTYLFLTADGKVVDIVSGFHSVKLFLPLLKSVKDRATSGELKNFSSDFDLAYPDFYRAAYLEGKRRIATETIANYLNEQSDLTAEIPFVLMTAFSGGEKYFDFYLEHAQEFAKNYSRMQVRNRLIDIARFKANKLGKTDETDAYEEVLAAVRPVFTDDEWPKFSEIFFKGYFKSSENAAWYINKVETSSAYDWQDRSNVAAEIIPVVKDQPEQLKKLAAWYKGHLSENSNSGDWYKAALIQLYLQDYDKAQSLSDRALAAESNRLLAKEDVQALKTAIETKNTSFEGKKVVNLKPIIMN